ncbi:MAG: peptidase M61 [Limnohabitans sp.]|nr:peptidase M61 [Limnohabitans sp.]
MKKKFNAVAIHYQVQLHNPKAHIYQVVLTIAQPLDQQTLEMPVWIAGSYMVREFSKQIITISARQENQKCAITQINKSTWVVDCSKKQTLELTYQVHARDNSVRTAWLDTQRGFLNGTSLFMRVPQLADQQHFITFEPNSSLKNWKLATGLTSLKIDSKGFGQYSVQDYDELVDCPVEMGDFWSGQFTARGVTHRFVVAGAPPTLDGERLLQDTQKICDAAIRMWHKNGKPPHKNYLFMLNAVSDGYGGLEHRNSTALICKRADLPRKGAIKVSDGYITLLGLISHEYFHTWNVKRLRPIEFETYDYAQENYTQLLWFFEGFTSYYDDLILRRANLITNAQYIQLINKTIHQVFQTPGRYVHTVAQSSFEAWTKYYRSDENTPNITVSYYTKGALIAMCLDLKLHVAGHHLDEVMRALWKKCSAGPMSEQDFMGVLKTLTGHSWKRDIQSWVHSTDELPILSLLQIHGVQVHHEAEPLAQQLGLRVNESNGVQIKTVLSNSPCEKAGFAPGDEWIGIEIAEKKNQAPTLWRMSKLDDLLVLVGPEQQVTALIARDQKILKLPINVQAPKTKQHIKLSIENVSKLESWLVNH